MPSLGVAHWVDLKILSCYTSPGSSFVQLSMYLFWFPEFIFGFYGYLNFEVSDWVAIEKSVDSQLAVPMSLDIRWNSYMVATPRNLLFFKFIIAYWKNLKLLLITLIEVSL